MSQVYSDISDSPDCYIIEDNEMPESDDELEDAPAVIRKSQVQNNQDLTSETSRSTPCKPGRLDALLAEHRTQAGKQEKQKALRNKLMTELTSDVPKEKYKEKDCQDLASEHVEHIEKLKVKSTKISPTCPGVAVFNADNYCCLFSDTVEPAKYITPTVFSSIEKILSSYTPEKLHYLLCSDTLVFSLATSPNCAGFMQWLLDLLSVHPCSMTTSNIRSTMIAILNRQKLIMNADLSWHPSSLALLRLLVNLGADPQELTYSPEILENEDLRNHLTKVTDTNGQQTVNRTLNSERFRAVLEILAYSLQSKSAIDKEDLNFMFYMLAKVALDESLDKSLARDFHLCFSAIISCYSNTYWPNVVNELSLLLSQVDSHHHNQVYLVSLLPACSKGSQLQIKLSFILLYKNLISGAPELKDRQLQDLKLIDVANLGTPVEEGQPSTLAVRLYELVKEDCYKAFSVLRLIDTAVGDVIYRSMKKKQMEYLLSQLVLVQRTIRDRVSEPDLMKLKDIMNHMTVKWSLALQHQRLNEGSIFPWATSSTHQLVKAEILMDTAKEGLTDRQDNNNVIVDET